MLCCNHFYTFSIRRWRISSVQFSHSVMSNSLRPHESQQARLPCPSPTPSLPKLMTIESVMPSSHLIPCYPLLLLPPQSLPASGSFPVSQLLTWGGQSIWVSASTSVLPMNNLDWSPLGWTNWISLQSKGPSRVFSNTTVQKHQFFGAQPSSIPPLTSIYDYWKNHSLDKMDFVGKVMSLLFNMLSRLVITFLPKSKNLLISWL